MSLPIRGRRELADALRTRAGLLGGHAFEAPATAAMMIEAADRLDPPGVLELDRSDLAALVANLAHEHFSYNGIGAAALRAYWKLQEAVEHDAAAIDLLDSPSQQTTKPTNQRTEP